MKLAEALLLRADLQKKLASLRERVSQYAVVQQGDRPHEDPNRLLREASGLLDQLEKLVAQINRVNLGHTLKKGDTLTEALARRDALVLRHSMLQAAIQGATKPPERYGLKEIKWVAKVNVAKLQKQADDLSKKLRLLNAEIQEANWKVEV